MVKRGYSAFLALVLMMCYVLLPSLSDIRAEAESGTVTVNLMTGQGNAMTNFYILNSVLSSADGVNELNVVLPKGGVYYIGTTGRALRIKSNTTIDLNGSTLIRSGNMLSQNLFQNCDNYGNKDAGGYSLTKNITIMNGRIDGAGNSSAAGNVNLLNFGHASDIDLISLELMNVRQGHLIELSGCENVRITGCTFSGFYGTPTGGNEAVQIDISKYSWNGAYAFDNTPSRNVTVSGCTFKDFPSGVGNHHSLNGGYHCSNITISGNSFINSKKYALPGAAIKCYGFDNCNVQNNTVRGYYSDGVRVNGGSANIISNSINTLGAEDSSGVYLTYANSYLYSQYTPSNKAKECITSGRIDGNSITGYRHHGVSVNGTSVITSVASNKIFSGKGSGVYVTYSKVTSGINGNTVSGCSRADADNLGHGIHCTSTSTVKKMTQNNITGCSGWGMLNYAKLTGMIVTANNLIGNSLGSQKISGTGTVNTDRAPNNVTGLRVTGRTSTSVKLSWTKSSNTTYYNIFRADPGSSSYVLVCKCTSTSFTDSRLRPGMKYKYAVCAVKNINGTEITSTGKTEISVTTNS